MPQTSIRIKLDSAVQARLAALAEDRKKPVSEVAAEVISVFFAPDSWEHRHIRTGMAELDAGKGVSNERVMEWLDSWGKQNELPTPK
jgi:predicted transcriptional regulator